MPLTFQDRLYEIDRSWQNNLVFYGIKPDSGGVYESLECLEHKVKTVIRNQVTSRVSRNENRRPGLPDFSWYNTPKIYRNDFKIYHIAMKYTKLQ
jgi:hypothetical protein